MGNKSKVKYVVTVLKDNVPIGIIEITRGNDRNHDVDLYYPDDGSLEDGKEAAEVAYHSLSYEIWKRTGALPPPVEYQEQKKLNPDTETPF